MLFTEQTAGQAVCIASSAKEQTAFSRSVKLSLEKVFVISQETRSGTEKVFQVITNIASEPRGLRELMKNMQR